MTNATDPQNLRDRTDTSSGTIRDQMGEGYRQARDLAAEQASTLRSQAGEYASGMARLARETMEERKSAGADAVSGVARAVSSAADELERESPMIARYVREAASSVESFSHTMRERSLQDMMRGTSDFVRRQPGTVFAGAVLAGLAMSRFAKSSAERRGDFDDMPPYGHRNYRSGYGPGTRSASANPAGYGSDRQPGYRPDVNVGGMTSPMDDDLDDFDGEGVRGTGATPGMTSGVTAGMGGTTGGTTGGTQTRSGSSSGPRSRGGIE